MDKHPIFLVCQTICWFWKRKTNFLLVQNGCFSQFAGWKKNQQISVEQLTENDRNVFDSLKKLNLWIPLKEDEMIQFLSAFFLGRLRHVKWQIYVCGASSWDAQEELACKLMKFLLAKSNFRSQLVKVS